MLTQHPTTRSPATAPAADLVAPKPCGASPPRASRTTGAWLCERIDGRVAVGVFAAWLVLTEVAVLLEPPAREGQSSIGTVLGVAMNVLFVATLAGLVARRRWAFAVSLAGASVATVASIACPVLGHHSYGAWWYGQMGTVVALVAISVAALAHRSRATGPSPSG